MADETFEIVEGTTKYVETTECDGTKDFPHRKGDGSWWKNDAQGISLCRVCDKCEKEKLSRYRPEILTGYDQSDVDELIEPDYGPSEERW